MTWVNFLYIFSKFDTSYKIPLILYIPIRQYYCCSGWISHDPTLFYIGYFSHLNYDNPKTVPILGTKDYFLVSRYLWQESLVNCNIPYQHQSDSLFSH